MRNIFKRTVLSSSVSRRTVSVVLAGGVKTVKVNEKLVEGDEAKRIVAEVDAVFDEWDIELKRMREQMDRMTKVFSA